MKWTYLRLCPRLPVRDSLLVGCQFGLVLCRDVIRRLLLLLLLLFGRLRRRLFGRFHGFGLDGRVLGRHSSGFLGRFSFRVLEL